MLQLDGGKTYDTAVLIDRQGRIAGKYRKSHLQTKDGLATRELELRRESRLWWLSVGPADGERKRLVIQEPRPHTYRPLIDTNP